jgi:phosphoesterase RecJ-like protein
MLLPNEILEAIRQNNTFVVAGHSGPDGDAIGSCYALAFALHKAGKKVKVLLEPYPGKYKIIPGKRFHYRGGKLEELTADVFIALDCADADRLGSYKQVFSRIPLTICIDHHDTNDGFADFNFIRADASSTSEMVLEVIESFTRLDYKIASAVYAGMVSDTGGFRFSTTAAATMETAARLMSTGIDFGAIYSELLFSHRFQSMKAMGVVLANAQQSDCGRVVFSYVGRAALAEVGAGPGGRDGVVEYLMGTRGALAACLVYERHSAPDVKVSLRSNGPNMGAVAKQFGGGGHVKAAGASTRGEIADVLAQAVGLVLHEVEKYDSGDN